MRLIILTLLSPLVVAILFSACQVEETDPCTQETISDPNYFSTDRTLSNTCVKGDGTDYYLTGNQTYIISGRLTIEPGTKIVIGDSAALIVEQTGSIYAIGRVDAPVEFTNESARSGAWWGILMRSTATNNVIKHVNVWYAGGAAIDTTVPTAAFALADGSSVDISYSNFSYSGSYGFAMQSDQANLQSLESNIFRSNAIPIRVPAAQAHKVTPTNTFATNTNSYIDVRVGNKIVEDVSWLTQPIPYRLFAEENSRRQIQAIGGNSQFSIREGNQVEFSENTGLLVEDNATFVAIGSESNPILFTGVRKASGSWAGFVFRNTQQSNTIRYAGIEHAGSDRAAITMWSNPRLDLANISFIYCPTCAIVDGPKTSTQIVNPNLSAVALSYTHVHAQYCKQQ